eukprot:355520-Chlamydomonas_euryale.AAC.2
MSCPFLYISTPSLPPLILPPGPRCMPARSATRSRASRATTTPQNCWRLARGERCRAGRPRAVIARRPLGKGVIVFSLMIRAGVAFGGACCNFEAVLAHGVEASTPPWTNVLHRLHRNALGWGCAA